MFSLLGVKADHVGGQDIVGDVHKVDVDSSFLVALGTGIDFPSSRSHSGPSRAGCKSFLTESHPRSYDYYIS